MTGESPEDSSGDNLVVRGAARAMEIVSLAYNDLSGLRALVSLIPTLGGPLDLLLSGEGARVEKQRVAKQLEDIRLAIEMVDLAKIDQEYLQREACYDWFALLLERTVRTGDKNKLEALRRVFIQGLTVEHSRGALKEIILRHVGDMTSAHIAVLRYITSNTEAKPQHPLIPEGAVIPIKPPVARVSVDGVSSSEVDAVVLDLLQMGIIDYDPPFGSWDVNRKSVLLTPFGWAFVGLMADPTQPST